MGINTNIVLYTEGTPNGLKPTILLAELDLEYKLVPIDIIAQANKDPWFLKINPNGRIPALTDVDGSGKELMWQTAGVGPMQGQANHFASEQLPYALSRYVHETRRLYRVLDNHLAQSASGYIIGDRVTIADIAIWPWVGAYKYSGLSTIDEFPYVKKWLFMLLQRPGFEKGRNAPGPHKYLKMNDMSEEELNNIAASLGSWVTDAMKRDAEA
ncbi:putative glutathione S-transferase [Colletotrichum sublineola]|uniref:Putative glutathione S-transferase n=1 Tax=Colletotrichum sublineola TaxID=1173701 RepID=A0A066X3J2_COLSU|nr:putative glutathione S-transferase [Colletotrichum sublineola]